MGPSLTFPPVPSWRGTRPSEAAKSRPLSKCLGSVTIAAIALLRIGPKPGMVSRRRAVTSVRARALMSLSRTPICISRADSSSRIVFSAVRATAATVVSSGSARMARSLPICCGPWGTTMPNSAIRLRSEFIAMVRCLISISRALCVTESACCSTVFIGTKRIDGLVPPDILLGISGWDQADGVTECGQFACPMVRRATCLDADQARGVFGEPCQHLAPPQRPANHNLLLGIHRVHLEYVLGQIEADSGNLRHGWLPLVGSDGIQLWHVDAVRGPSTPSWPGCTPVPAIGRGSLPLLMAGTRPAITVRLR